MGKRVEKRKGVCDGQTKQIPGTSVLYPHRDEGRLASQRRLVMAVKAFAQKARPVLALKAFTIHRWKIRGDGTGNVQIFTPSREN